MIREIAKKNVENFVDENLDRLNELTHASHNHLWIEVYPDGSVNLAEEASMQTSHWIEYGKKAVASVLEVATCQYCDCDACLSYKQAHDDDVDEEEFHDRWGYSKEEVGNDFSSHLRDLESYDYDMPDKAMAAIDQIEYGYFDDETKP